MIKIDGNIISVGHYPDGTLLIKTNPLRSHVMCNISWFYDSEEELLALIYLVNQIRQKYGESYCIKLHMPYVPNARMDRVRNETDVFTLKYFAHIINSLHFSSVDVLDVHSTVTEALVDHIYDESPISFINEVLDIVSKQNDTTIFYPDAGSVKRYSDAIKMPYVYGNKTRDWSTGKILGLEVIGDQQLISDHDILIVDDICSRGGTFYYAAKKLKELGANKIYLWVSHCENTVIQGDLIKSGLVDQIFTTDSIFTESHPLINVIHEYRKLTRYTKKDCLI